MIYHSQNVNATNQRILKAVKEKHATNMQNLKHQSSIKSIINILKVGKVIQSESIETFY